MRDRALWLLIPTSPALVLGRWPWSCCIAAQTLVTPGQEITVVYNPVKAPVAIPDVRGQTLEQATAALSAAGFTVSPTPVFVASQQPEQARLLLGFDAFGHHLELQRMRQADDGGY